MDDMDKYWRGQFYKHLCQSLFRRLPLQNCYLRAGRPEFRMADKLFGLKNRIAAVPFVIRFYICKMH